MKTAFSTLGCPEWSFSEILSTASDLGFEGIEFRGVEGEIYMPRVKEFSLNAADTLKKLKAANIEVPVLTSGAVAYEGGSVNEARDYIDTAEKMGCPYVRVLADKTPAPLKEISENDLVKNLKIITDYAADKKVAVLIETNGAYSKSENILRLLNLVNSKNLFVIWDVHYTYRFGGEAPQYTVNKLGGLIKHVHLKDSINDNGKIIYKLLGDGDIPVNQAVKSLKEINYKGFLCLEWVKRWAADIAEPGIAFPSFIYYIKNILKSV